MCPFLVHPIRLRTPEPAVGIRIRAISSTGMASRTSTTRSINELGRLAPFPPPAGLRRQRLVYDVATDVLVSATTSALLCRNILRRA
jgi:hypothetical protein